MINPRHILITGASSGIGAALSLLYATHGIHLSLHGRHSERLSEIAERARRQGAEVHICIGDITNEMEMDIWIRACDQRSSLDLVIANAGISAGTSGAYEEDKQVRQIFSTNINGVLNTIHPVLPLFTQRKKGQIAIISSLASFRGFGGSAAYCASKAAVRVYGEALRSQCLPFGVEVNVVCPGYIKTPMTDVNKFPMPFIMLAERAALYIRDGLESGKPRIAFPWTMYGLIRLLNALPEAWLDKPLSLLPKKGH